LADRFLYFNDDMMFVGPVESTDFFSNEGKVNLRGPRGRKQFLSKTGDPLNLL
jgi:hypothetical protein